MQQKREKLRGIEKAAVLLVSLGPEISSKVFKYMKDDEIENLTLAIAKVDKVEPEEKDKIFKEFQEMMMAQKFISQGGIDYAREILEKALGPTKAIEIINRLTSTLQTRPFDLIRRTDPAQLLNFIHGEHPQTIALILAFLPPDKAAVVLSQLPPELQADVAKRIAVMERTSPEVIREVEKNLEKKLVSLVSEDYTSTGGIPAIVDVLNLVDRGTEKTIIETLEEEDPELAEEIKKRMFVFEDIVMLDDKAVQLVLREIDMKELALALKAVDDVVKNKIFKNMSQRAGSMLREDMEYMGPVRLRDVEEAQQKIVNVIRKLEEAGEIIISRGGEEEFVV